MTHALCRDAIELIATNVVSNEIAKSHVRATLDKQARSVEAKETQDNDESKEKEDVRVDSKELKAEHKSKGSVRSQR